MPKHFIGTTQELESLMKTSLSRYVSDESFLLEIENMENQEKINTLEAIATCIDKHYVENLDYIRTLDGSIHIRHFVRDLQTDDNITKDSHPVCLSEQGKIFLGI